MPRFYLDAELAAGQQLSLPDAVVRHIQVLRLNAGDAITLFNGRGGEYHAALTSVLKRDAQCVIERFDEVSRETPLWLGLAQGISSGDKMEFTLQKGVEMGVAVFQPIAAGRSVVKLSGERADKRVARWQEIVISACEQSGRNTVPQVLPILTLSEWLAQRQQADVRLVLSPRGDRSLAELAERPARSWLMVGPEGGFSGPEEDAALAAGWTPLKLGPRILRTETAALAAVGAMQAVWGDYQ
ncbi:16S rRNA (uracil(1498)-N(3))-methyltransferase [Chromobacterium phragmitis]|uniref:Ribosomal RNA small subunit methyltransferase E n=1 Tax=Chromobacterium phragmitis TaxID=2202141 RepID=A0A344UIN9_9NEIS|nr:16S rRNA (uracil(1498)-N(3))-methyltransferase [Chromobacterium phragmitis]AXE29750.1 16S rRNA (uracil(1498)-N(3))-methyltransferase [Chromobacterium phragmitis]AXE35137.1 16S rRNA (uracil(1498)-N(3))-methyltransferase [Chromobacterium phragmitis]